MQAIKGKDTSIEIKLRKALWDAGIRYRKNYTKLIGKPDIVITKYKIAVFCDSDFWHGRDWEINKYKIKSNHDYWIPKIESNIARDNHVNQILQKEGWTVLRIWEKEIQKDLPKCIDLIFKSMQERNAD